MKAKIVTILFDNGQEKQIVSDDNLQLYVSGDLTRTWNELDAITKPEDESKWSRLVSLAITSYPLGSERDPFNR